MSDGNSAAAPPQPAHAAPNYKAVFVWLAVLTAFEVAVVYVPLPEASIATLLIVSALAKAVLVALYFMHLIAERFLIIFAVVFSLALSAIFVLGLFPDIVLGPLRLK